MISCGIIGTGGHRRQKGHYTPRGLNTGNTKIKIEKKASESQRIKNIDNGQPCTPSRTHKRAERSERDRKRGKE